LIDRRLAQPCGQRWLRQHSVDSPILVQHLIDKFQSILSKYAELANQNTFRTALRDGNAINPRLFENANQYASIIEQHIDQSISQHDVKHWSGIPRWVAMLKIAADAPEIDTSNPRPPKIPKTNPPSTAGNPTPSGPTGSRNPPPGGGGAGAAPTPAQLEQRKTLGFLTWAGPRNPPTCPVMWTSEGTGNEKRLCLFFASKGLSCQNTSCPNIHCPAFAKVPAAKQAALKTFVAATAGLTFSPGQGPAGT
jgi:hypothetical protein